MPTLRGFSCHLAEKEYTAADWSEMKNGDRFVCKSCGSILVASPVSQGLWPFEQPVISTSADGLLGRIVLGFGQDLAGEIYVLTTGRGNTGQVFKIGPPAS